MNGSPSRQVVVAGGGIAGLTAALAFARHGFAVRVFEQTPQFEPVGAGLQLSPNATRILERLGVLQSLRPAAVEPDSVLLRDAASLKVLTRIPLCEFAGRRWGAPYLTAHRADLHEALLAAVSANGIGITAGVRVTGDVTFSNDGVTVAYERDGHRDCAEAGFIVAADGVWSALRANVFPQARRCFTGFVAWRTTIAADSPAGEVFRAIGSPGCVNAFLDPRFHLVAYPVSGGAAFNLVAFTKGSADADGRAAEHDASALIHATRRAAPALMRLLEQAGDWTIWPLNTVEVDGAWTQPAGVAMIGDAAHAMTPFAAQGAAMAIEDAAALASVVAAAATRKELPARLRQWEQVRKARVAKVRRRGALNKLAWNAAGPLALGRNLLLRLRPAASLAADLDWLYGYDAERIASSE